MAHQIKNLLYNINQSLINVGHNSNNMATLKKQADHFYDTQLYPFNNLGVYGWRDSDTSTLKDIIDTLKNEAEDIYCNKRAWMIVLKDDREVNTLNETWNNKWKPAFVPMLKQLNQSVFNHTGKLIHHDTIKDVLHTLEKNDLIEFDYATGLFGFIIILKDQRLIEMAGGKWLNNEEFNFNKTIDEQCRILNDHIAKMEETVRNLQDNKIATN